MAVKILSNGKALTVGGKLSTNLACCCTPPHCVCPDANLPASYQAVLSGFTGWQCWCGDFNGTFVLTPSSTGACMYMTYCCYAYQPNIEWCGEYLTVSLILQAFGSSAPTKGRYVLHAGGYTFTSDWFDPFDCQPSGLVIAGVRDRNDGLEPCHGTTSCTLTAL